MDTITLQNPLDMHVHLREGEILESVLGFTMRQFSCALAMPNLRTPLTNTDLVKRYEREILDCAAKTRNKATSGDSLESNDSQADFVPLMSLYMMSALDENELKKAKNEGINIIKLYPQGATTGSQSGVSEILDNQNLKIFESAQNLGFILSIHGETNGFCMDREYEFNPIIAQIAKTFPRLKIIFEHVSDRRSIDMIEAHDNIFATLTLHHITMDLDSVIGGALNPHAFCKPILKTKKDKEALASLALEAHPKFSFGSDSAPHVESSKLKGAAGIFSAPILLPRLCEFFETHNKLENLQKFISDNACNIYDIKNIPQKSITLQKKPFAVPQAIHTLGGDIIPLCAKETISWGVESVY